MTIDEEDEISSSAWEDFGSGDYMWARVAMEPGVHQLKADKDVGLVVYGYDSDVSYAYPGGANLTPLETEE